MDEQGVRDDQYLRLAVDFITRNHLKIDVWKILDGPALDAIDAIEARYDMAGTQVDVLARVFGDLGCRYSIYNHGGWGGTPEAMVEVAKRADSPYVGIAYNFHHGHEHMANMQDSFTAMLPYLTCVNLNGVTEAGPTILPLSAGEQDLRILRMIQQSGYAGPVGILDHRPEIDAEFSLTQNFDGIQKLLRELGDDAALRTYQ